jgi:hypothetical protein
MTKVRLKISDCSRENFSPFQLFCGFKKSQRLVTKATASSPQVVKNRTSNVGSQLHQVAFLFIIIGHLLAPQLEQEGKKLRKLNHPLT